jgi:hypothetical protein
VGNSEPEGLKTIEIFTSSRAIAVLGMHRSGTSALAGTLRAAGVYFGEVLDQSIARNPKGLQEAPSLLYMQEDLLVKNGGSWHEPPEKIDWDPMHKAVRDLFIECRASQDLWAFKDPRTLLTLEGWFSVLPDLECVGTFRHPTEVVMSIHERNEFELEKCFDIWCAYNERLLAHQEKRGFTIVEFVAQPDVMQSSFANVLASLGLSETEESLAFFDAEMKHLHQPSIKVPARAQNIFEALRKVAV